jgi:hypothetical protein
VKLLCILRRSRPPPRLAKNLLLPRVTHADARIYRKLCFNSALRFVYDFTRGCSCRARRGALRYSRIAHAHNPHCSNLMTDCAAAAAASRDSIMNVQNMTSIDLPRHLVKPHALPLHLHIHTVYNR